MSGAATPSPALIDLRLDFINLRRDYNSAVSADFVIGMPNMQLPNAQVLNSLSNGYIYNTAGIVSTVVPIPIGDLPNLTEGKIWIGDEDNRPVENTTIALSNLPDLTQGKLWIGDTNNRTQEGDPIPGPQGPQGPKGPQGYPGLSFIAVMKQIFRRILEEIFGSALGGIASDVLDELFDIWFQGVLKSIEGAVGLIGASGLAGLAGLAGLDGLDGAPGTNTIIIKTNLNLAGNRIENIAQSPGGDFDAVSARFVWDLLHDNVIIQWQ